jgi:hypothetical protein
MEIEQIARVCHETNRAFCQTIGDQTQKPWDEAEQWQKYSAIEGVVFAISTPGAPASTQHDAWCADKVKDGWVWGAEKNAALKTHPCLVPYEQLPVEQRLKGYLFKAVVSAFVQANLEEPLV